MKPGVDIATEYAKIWKLESQKEGESDADFRGRVADALRDAGSIIEAHEAFNNERYEEGDDVMTGIIGAAAQALQGRNYGSTGERKFDDDFATGTIVQAPKDDNAAMALLAVLLLGGNR